MYIPDYQPAVVESKWQKHWAEARAFESPQDYSRPKYYCLLEFPYPSGEGLHAGHPRPYTALDIIARKRRMEGYNVLFPMGWDAFGLPTENFAIKHKIHPRIVTERNINRFRSQMQALGFSFDWTREVDTTDPNYYKWTQWIFLQLFDSWYDPAADKARPISELIARFEAQGCSGQDASVLTGDVEEFIGEFSAAEWNAFDERTKQLVLQHFRLAYLSDAWVNWCPALGTVLANDEVKDGVSERGGHPVERKRMKQWSLRITAYAQRLVDGLDGLDWSESIKEAQRNWIGRSEGATVRFPIDEDFIEVFTTRPDTLFGVSFITLAPEHVLVSKFTTPDRRAEVEAYVHTAKNRSERERQAEVDKVSGVFTGSYAKHPFTGEDIPVWVGDYVLAGYGTGAVMAVPGGDQRDWRFAKHFDLPIIAVTEGADITRGADESKEGVICSEGFLKGLPVKEAIPRAIAELEKLGAGERRINFRLRDAAFGRQRYWGEPIPIYYKDDVPYPLPESELPLKLPEVDKFLPTEDGEPPLARATDWNYEGHPLETTTMPGWAGSSWYFLRYMDPQNAARFASREAVDYWGQIDLYMGGSEHATGHLLYFRFWTKFLHDRGWIPFDEPAKKLVNQGMIQGVSQFIYRLLPVVKGVNDPFEKLGMEVNGRHGMIGLPERTRHVYVSIDAKPFFSGDSMLGQWNFGLFQKLHVDVKHVSGGKLDFTGFVKDLTFEPDEDVVFVFHAGIISLKHGAFRYPGVQEDFVFQLGTDTSELPTTEGEVEKMSKSKFNVVNPDEIISKYGADTLRLYEMFLGPLEQSKPWDTNGIEGTFRFLKKFWNLFHQGGESGKDGEKVGAANAQGASDAPVASTHQVDLPSVTDEVPTKPELKILHATLKKVTEDIERMSFNTSVSRFMIAANELGALKCTKRAVLEPLVIALAPFAPHIAEELWEKLGHNTSVTTAVWPQWDAQYLVEDNFSYPISFNGKTRLQLEFPIAMGKEEVEAAVLANPEVQARLEGKAPKKVIVVPKRIVNIVV